MDIKIIEFGTAIKIKITVNGIVFYSAKEFDTEEEAKQCLQEHDLKSN